MSIVGRVLRWNDEQGKGFLSRDDGGEAVPVTRAAIDGGSLVVGLPVTFAVVVGKGGQDVAADVAGSGKVARGGAADAKMAAIAARAAENKAEASKACGVVRFWNDLIGKGRIELKGQSVNVARADLIDGYSLMTGGTVYFDVAQDENGAVAENVSGDAVVDEGVLDELTSINGVKKGLVISWSSEKGEGQLSWEGGQNITVRSKDFNLSVGAHIEYEIDAVSMEAKNCKGVAVIASAGQRNVSSKLKSMKFMKRKEEATERLQAQERALKDMEQRDQESRAVRQTGINSNIRVVVSDDFPITYHAVGRRKFGQVDAPPPKVDVTPVADGKKKSVRYHQRSLPDEKPVEEKFFAGKKRKRDGPPDQRGKRRGTNPRK
eukprot:TRINITY_DN14385_c0_g2_i1.p1 TRINITY_DN14385_c0_g2~~TRINITY_DN14385_c0_g2_i1.p1  ORF type:complete len:377 (+),score=138.19 TRINITY_DN14385_c0_g2_i1:81-1211(+)